MKNYNIEHWLKDSDLTAIEYSDYWNDEEEESKKEWWLSIMARDFARMEKSIIRNEWLSGLEECIEMLRASWEYELRGTGLDLAAGVLWSAPHLLKNGMVDKLFMVEYSKQRILKLGPLVLDHYNIPQDKVVLAFGSFYDIHIKNEAVDFVFLSSAFHHASNPDALLLEIKRVLKKNGVVMVIGEPIADFYCVVRHIIKYIVSRAFPCSWQKKFFGKTMNVPRLFVRPNEPISKDECLGDRVYTNSQYHLLFKENGFSYKRLKNTGSLYQSFLLFKNRS